MKYTEITKPGMGDPYWYEYSVGLQYIVDMLNPDNHIKYVELQADVPLGLDDVVVTYEDGRVRFIQVKHTRANDTITFGDLVTSKGNSIGESTGKKISLLAELAKSWEDSKSKYPDSEVYVFTNRISGRRASKTGPKKSIKRPALSLFWQELKRQVLSVQSFTDIQFTDYDKAWHEWCQQLEYINNDEDKLLFLKKLHIETDQENLKELGEAIRDSLRVSFSCSEQTAELLLGKLDHALRTWTTSLRTSSKIDIEDVYNALSIKEEVITYNQDLIPADPFFASRINLVIDLENELLQGDSKVIFLSGIPGTGKTNIISKLCCKKESLIDIRYYAYEPIDPGREYIPADVSRRVDANVFWDTLLNQLRDLLRGKLYKYRIPVLNSFLSVEEKRNEFLRIASEHARDERRIFVVAVDGLDHAARAGCVENTFLPTLPYPEYIPDNVKFLVAGQPKENYNSYPIWLKQSSNDIKEFIVPEIQPTDVQDLVEAKCQGISADIKQLITKIICSYAEGNTLSAIFAVHEAALSGNPVDIERKLQKRHLSGNIQEYYRTIWEEAKESIGAAFIDYKMAGVFAFFNESISAEKLIDIFPDEGISKTNWKNILKSFRPLLVEQNGCYTILHNDVRIFLSAFIGLDQEHVQEVYSNLADYYIGQRNKTEGYYRDAIHFLTSSGRGDEFEKVYSTEYIISAYVNGIELDELRESTDSLLKMIVHSDNFKWNHLRSLAMGYMTIDQIEKCRYEIEDSSFRITKHHIKVHPYECFVEPETKWNSVIITDVLRQVCLLYESGEYTRGRTLFHNWFSGMNCSRLESLVVEDDDDIYTSDTKSITELAGRASAYVGDYSLLSEVKTESGDISSFANAVIGQALQEIFNIYDLEQFSTAIDSVEVLILNPIIVGIKKLIDQNRFEQLKRLEVALSKRNFNNVASQMLYIFLKIINGTASWTDTEAQELWKEIGQIRMPDEHIENLMSYYTIYAIVSAYLQGKSRADVANEITKRYLSSHQYKRPQYFLLYFNCVCFLGKWLKSRNTNSVLYDTVSDLTNIMENLYHKKWSPNDRDFETCYLRTYILKGFILLAKGENRNFQSEFEKELERIFSDNPANQLLDPGLMFYSDNTARMQKWVDSWLDEGGKVWSEGLGERNRIISQFIVAVNRYDKNGLVNLRGAEDKAKWSVIGFASHKEYTIDILLHWYNILIEYDENNIVTYSQVVKDISDTIELVGDNRIEYLLNSKIFSDWGSLGVRSIQSVLKKQRYLSQSIEHPGYLVEILIGYLKHAELSRKQLVIIWGLCIGLLDWRNEDNHATICSLQRAIELKAEEMGIFDIRSDLFTVGPAYIDLAADPIRYIIPEHWYDKAESIVEEENVERLVKAYLENHIDKANKGSVLRAIKCLHFKGQLNQALLEDIINHELQSASYSIHQNSILEFVVGIASKAFIDKAIVSYLSEHLESEYFYPEQDLPTIISWRMASEGEEYCRESVDELLDTYRCWLTAANHIKEPEAADNYN